MNEYDLNKSYEALGIAVVVQAAKDKAKGFFVNEDQSMFPYYMPNVDGKAMWKQIEQNYKEYGTYRVLEDVEIESKWQQLKSVKFNDEGRLNRNFFVFDKGDPREVIEEWFDKHYSKGLAGLRGV